MAERRPWLTVDADGRVTGWSGEAADALGVAGWDALGLPLRHVAEYGAARGRAAREREILRRGGTEVGTTMDMVRTAEEFTGLLVPGLADVASVDLLEPVIRGEYPPSAPVAADVPLRRAAFEAGGRFVALRESGDDSRYIFPTPFTQTLTDLEPRLFGEIDHGAGWLENDPAHAAWIRAVGAHSLMVVPLSVHGLVLGLVSLYRVASTPRPFGEADLSLAAQLAARAALSIDNARRVARERSVARALQHGLQPRELPVTTALDVAHVYLPGQVDAHWFDVIPLSSARVGVVVGHVDGHGLQATVTMGRFRTVMSTLAMLELSPAELLVHLDDVASRIARDFPSDPVSPDRSWPGRATCVYAIYDPVASVCTVASAGHPPPVLMGPDGSTWGLDVPVGPPLGRGAAYDSVSVSLETGTVLTLVPDTLTRPDDAMRMERLWEVLAGSVSGSVEEIRDSVVYDMVPRVPKEGFTLLVARTRVLPQADVATWAFPSDPAIVGDAREAVRRQVREWGLEARLFAVELMVSEMVSNVVLHAQGPIGLRLINDRALTIEVSDAETTAPHLRHARMTDESGRGLYIVARLSERWGTRYTQDGKTVWAQSAGSEDVREAAEAGLADLGVDLFDVDGLVDEGELPN